MADPQKGKGKAPSRREIFEATLSGEQDRPWIPRLRSDPPPYHPVPKTLAAFREEEGRAERKRRLQALWKHLCKQGYHFHREAGSKTIAKVTGEQAGHTLEKAEKLRAAYEDELLSHVGGHTTSNVSSQIGWNSFKEYAEEKETGALAISVLEIYLPIL
jgi:solute carrier family 25 (mitochondrial phosphate transporter), member 23/24/25/41